MIRRNAFLWAGLVLVAAGTAPGQPDREPASFRDVVRKVAPAVVNIEVRAAGGPRTTGDREDGSLGFGSGFLIDPAGVVLTNSHVVDGATEVVVELADGRRFGSKDVRRDPKTDLAVIKLAADKPLPSLTLGDSEAMEVGDRVLAVGAPFGLTGSVTSGIVSAKSRRNLRLNQYEDFLQTDAAINPGNSGGPLVNLAGEAVGVTAAIKTKSGGFQGVGLAVSSNLAKEVVRQLLADGVVRRGYLGISVRDLDAEQARRAGIAREAGVIVTRVEPGSPAAKAGLRVGDVVTAIAGTPVRDPYALPRLVAQLPLGRPTAIRYLRDGKIVAQAVTIEEQSAEYGTPPAAPPPVAVPDAPPAAGLAVADLTAEEAARLGYPRETRGVVVTSEAAGFARGTVIVRVDRTPVATAGEFTAALAAASPERGALLHVLRPSGEVDYVVLRVK